MSTKVKHYGVNGFIKELKHWGSQGAVVRNVLRLTHVSRQTMLARSMEVRASFLVPEFMVELTVGVGEDWPEKEKAEADARAERLMTALREAATEIGVVILEGEYFPAEEQV